MDARKLAAQKSSMPEKRAEGEDAVHEVPAADPRKWIFLVLFGQRHGVFNAYIFFS